MLYLPVVTSMFHTQHEDYYIVPMLLTSTDYDAVTTQQS